MIKVVNHWDDEHWELPDEEALWSFAQEHLPEVMLRFPKSTDDLIRAINAKQNYSVARLGVAEDDLQIPEVSNLIRAARLLARKPTYGDPAWRAACVLHEGDPEAAALVACGLQPTDENRLSLAGILVAQSKTNKAEPPPETPVELEGPVFAPHAEGAAVATQVQKAIDAHRIEAVKLDGRHSKGALLAHPPDGQTIYLKPGSGSPSPALGVRENPASQSQREAGFWHALESVGMGGWSPRADLVVIGPQKRAYAALEWLGHDWEPVADVLARDPIAVRHALAPLKLDGTLHRLAAMFYILAESDAHSHNGMWHDGQIRLIDHGSALAGDGFAPEHDPNTFVPWFLRLWVPADEWPHLGPLHRYERLPAVSSRVANDLAAWILALDGDGIAAALKRYGTDPEPCLRRLAALRQTVTRGVSADEAVNLAWTMGLDGPYSDQVDSGV